MPGEIGNPAGGRGRRSPYLEARIDGLDRGGRLIVEPEIIRPAAGPEDLEVWLVPDLEPPVAYFGGAVAVDEVLRERADEAAPAAPVFRRRNDRAVVEDHRRGVPSQSPWHEGE